MIKDLSAPIYNLDGTPVMDGEKAVTAQTIIIQALVAQYPDETGVTGDEKFNRFNLAVKINKDANQDLKPEDIVLIKRLVGKGWGPLIVGPIFELLNA